MEFAILLAVIAAFWFMIHRACYGSHIHPDFGLPTKALQVGEIAITCRGFYSGERFVPHDQEIELTAVRQSDYGPLWSGRWLAELGEDAIELEGIPESALQPWIG